MPFINIFRLKIELENDNMNTPDDVARALRALADRLEAYQDFENFYPNTVWDVNGNEIGRIQVGRELV
jgi:DNA-directed RNA polymerase subunit L